MGLLTPRLPDIDLDDWSRQHYPQRLAAMCRSWVVQGFGAPLGAYLFYAVKLVVWIGVWVWLVVRTPGVGGVAEIGTWWATVLAFQKAVIWTLVYEGLGLGCGSGPLTARYVPPIGGVLHFARPGTVRLPPFPRVPLTAGDRRTPVDVVLYLGFLAVVVRALLAPSLLGLGELLPIIAVLGLLGLRDKTVFLATRPEHYLATVVVFCFPGDLVAGSQAVMLAIWWGAASSKLNAHFPSVIAVMVSNSPLFGVRRLRTAMCRDYPHDLRPSRLASSIAHGGTVIEYAFPLLLLLGGGGWATTVGLVVMLAFHGVITLSFPLGVPIEWNLFFLYAGFALFGTAAGVTPLDLESPLLIALLLVVLVAVPIVGNLRPDKVSFLPSMRYYAGNWATSLWLLREPALARLDTQVTKAAPVVQEQLRRFYDEPTMRAITGKALAFRSMHLHGRALNLVLPRVVDDLDDAVVDDYVINDGEWIAGVVLGWNFGEGHLHHEQLLAAVQARCGFEAGEVRCVFLESQPAGRDTLHWRIADAALGRVAEGHVAVADLLAAQPWPDHDEVWPDER